MSTPQQLDTNCMTLTRFVLNHQRNHPEATGVFTDLINALGTSVKAISSSVRKAGLAKLHGITGELNVQGEEVKKLDVLANDLFINMLTASYSCQLMISEENPQVIQIANEKRGKYIVAFDPLDGSSNIDCLASIGSIFAVYHKPDCENGLVNGNQIVAAGYAIYGSATMLVLSMGETVDGFTLDPAIGEFVLTDPHMVIPSKGKIYSVNEGNEASWVQGIRDYVKSRKYPKTGKPYSSRYIGSMVPDVHRTIKYGGLFMYPGSTDAPNGKLRLLYECNPMAFLVEKAGGKALSAPNLRILDIQSTQIHQRAPIFLGSQMDVDEVISYL